ncbi:hypothetical protein BO70DRAFT_394133 [Aspergillus heteromorphus CBS 117.55]|uniref:Rhodopsin domain-containing protein n=1 Tax=Aspergillus heteromorphus CBS 117.55 TaxID=1448321 RepID=A0A317WPS5_9EURO|nr:uncharacterized protein BO70DRAFT_394133 [Aspergillus heteromorphus CBS 117.55]PWY88423.1 hypothetical protein BO70DRAFT_394133 [Aspergillus heteromorphus CBS 117.55]
MSTKGTLSTGAYVAVGTPLIVLCAGFVALRCWMSYRVYKKLLIADYLSILGCALVTIAFSMNDIIIQRFMNPTHSLNWLNCMAVVITVVIAFELWTTKVPILLLYVKLFGIQKWLRWTCHACLAITGVAYICVMAPTFMRCNPSTTEATLTDLAVCTTGTTLTGVLSGFIALAQDVLIFFLPIPLVLNLHMPRGRKLAVGAVFFTGILGIVASIVSLYFKWEAYTGAVSDTLATMLCAVIEGTTAIMVGCAPSIKQFWSTTVGTSLSSSGPTRDTNTEYASSHRSRDLMHYKKMGLSEVDMTPLQPK